MAKVATVVERCVTLLIPPSSAQYLTLPDSVLDIAGDTRRYDYSGIVRQVFRTP